MKVLVLAALAVVGYGQSFEVASIRLNREPITDVGFDINGVMVTGTALAVHAIISYAYDLRSYQVSGIPYGLDAKERYDILARAPGDTPPTLAQARRMFQSLLADRFQLKFHRETRQMDIYALVPAKGGPKLVESSQPEFSMFMNGTSMTFKAAPLSRLALQLTGQPGIDHPVLDKTGIAGVYDFVLNYAPNPNDRQITGPGGESIFTAVQEQLGLKLERQKAPIEVLVVDSVQKPSEN